MMGPHGEEFVFLYTFLLGAPHHACESVVRAATEAEARQEIAMRLQRAGRPRDRVTLVKIEPTKTTRPRWVP